MHYINFQKKHLEILDDYAKENAEKLIADAGMKNEDIDYLIPHQANLRIIQAVRDRLGYSDEKVVTNIKYYGNTSAASIPLSFF